MAQPEYVPLDAASRVRPAERLPAPAGWRADRPAEVPPAGRPTGRRFGSPGPDQGYALTLAEGFADRLLLMPGEQVADAVAGCLGVALKRASLFGRAPVVHDLDLAFTVWGFLGDPPDDLVAHRVPLFRGAAHDYWAQRGIVDRVAESTLRSTPDQVRALLPGWRDLLVV